MRCSWPIAQTGFTVFVVSPFPLVVRLSGNPEVPTRARYISGRLGRLLQDLEPPRK
jgi:hypothetical protein